MSWRPGSLIAVTGVFLISVLGYVAMQQYIERSLVMEKEKSGIKETVDFEMLKAIEIVTPDKEKSFVKTHSDGMPVDYIIPAKYWPNLKKGYAMYLFKEGCVLTTRPKESCHSQTYVTINNASKKAFYIKTMDDLPLALDSIKTEEDALALAEFITSLEISKYFGVYFVNLTPSSSENDAQMDATGFHVSQKAWERLELPQPEVKSMPDKTFSITRAGFVPFGEKQIVMVKESVAQNGSYSYEIQNVLYQGALVPIKVKSF